jgi:hypothetical protein
MLMLKEFFVSLATISVLNHAFFFLIFSSSFLLGGPSKGL